MIQYLYTRRHIYIMLCISSVQFVYTCLYRYIVLVAITIALTTHKQPISFSFRPTLSKLSSSLWYHFINLFLVCPMANTTCFVTTYQHGDVIRLLCAPFGNIYRLRCENQLSPFVKNGYWCYAIRTFGCPKPTTILVLSGVYVMALMPYVRSSHEPSTSSLR